MPCYCNDISRINQDIRTLKSLLAKVDFISGQDSRQDTALASLSEKLTLSVTPENIHALTEKTGKLNAKTAANRANMSRRVSAEISSLQTRLASLQTADRRYHDSLMPKGR